MFLLISISDMQYLDVSRLIVTDRQTDRQTHFSLSVILDVLSSRTDVFPHAHLWSAAAGCVPAIRGHSLVQCIVTGTTGPQCPFSQSEAGLSHCWPISSPTSPHSSPVYCPGRDRCVDCVVTVEVCSLLGSTEREREREGKSCFASLRGVITVQPGHKGVGSGTSLKSTNPRRQPETESVSSYSFTLPLATIRKRNKF